MKIVKKTANEFPPRGGFSGNAALPPWDDDQAMYRWVDRILDDEDTANYNQGHEGCKPHTLQFDPSILNASVIEAAWMGDIGPLRKMYPQLVPFLALPPVRARNAWRKSHELTVTAMLAINVKRINAIWKKHYGHVNRRRGLMTAVEIASRRFGFDASAIDQYQHPSGPSGKRKVLK
jgi:hypothetical protein